MKNSWVCVWYKVFLRICFLSLGFLAFCVMSLTWGAVVRNEKGERFALETFFYFISFSFIQLSQIFSLWFCQDSLFSCSSFSSFSLTSRLHLSFISLPLKFNFKVMRQKQYWSTFDKNHSLLFNWIEERNQFSAVNKQDSFL